MDRTDTVVFILHGVLNMLEEDMRREYLLTSYVQNDLLDSTNIDVIISGLVSYEGDTIQEEVAVNLLEIGVTEEKFTRIKEDFQE